MAHERGLSLEIDFGFGSLPNAFPNWTQSETSKALIPLNSLLKGGPSFMMTEIPSLDNSAIREGFYDFLSEAFTVVSLYRKPEGPVVAVNLDFSLYEYSLNANANDGFSDALRQRYHDIASFNLVYGTHFKDFAIAASDNALRNLVDKRPWLFSYDYQWCRTFLLERYLREIMESPFSIPMLSLFAEGSEQVTETCAQSQINVVLEGTLLNSGPRGFFPFSPGGSTCQTYSLGYELYVSMKKFCAKQNLHFTVLSQKNDADFSGEEIFVICSKFLQKKHWGRLLAAMKNGAKVHFLLDVPQYDELMHRYELKGFKPECDLRGQLQMGHGNLQRFFNHFAVSSAAGSPV